MSDVMMRDLTSLERRHNAHFATNDGFRVIGSASTGQFADANGRISRLWDELASRPDDIGVASEWLSPCHGRETEFSCYLGLGSDERPSAVPKGMVTVQMPPHEYAVASGSGTRGDVKAMYTSAGLGGGTRSGAEPVDSLDRGLSGAVP